MDTYVKDLFQVTSWIATAFGVMFAVIKFPIDMRESREQRERDLRWRKAEAGKALNDEMQTDPRAFAAMQMIDYPRRTFTMPSGKSVEIATAMEVPGEVAGVAIGTAASVVTHRPAARDAGVTF